MWLDPSIPKSISSPASVPPAAPIVQSFTMSDLEARIARFRTARSDEAVLSSKSPTKSSARLPYSSWLEPIPSQTQESRKTHLDQWLAGLKTDPATRLSAVQKQVEQSLPGLDNAACSAPVVAATEKSNDMTQTGQPRDKRRPSKTSIERRWTTGDLNEAPNIELRGIGGFIVEETTRYASLDDYYTCKSNVSKARKRLRSVSHRAMSYTQSLSLRQMPPKAAMVL